MAGTASQQELSAVQLLRAITCGPWTRLPRQLGCRPLLLSSVNQFDAAVGEEPGHNCQGN